MTEMAVATVPQNGAALAEQVVVKGNLAGLSEQERMTYYSAVCDSLGLNPLTRPFEYITLNGKLTLYATRAATDQLRAIKGITITSLDPRQIGDLFVVVATGRDRTGREDSSTGAVGVAGLRGEALANAMMKAETKAKRRLTLSLAGLGMTDETEVDSIPDAVRVETPHLSLAERAAAKAAEVSNPTTQEASSEPSVETEDAEASGVEASTEAAGEDTSPGPSGPAAAVPHDGSPLGRLRFMDALQERTIALGDASTKAEELFPGVEPKSLTDAQRGQLLAALTA